MPENRQVFGMVVAMNYHDHASSHFHGRYGKQKAVIGIEPVELLKGKLSPQACTLVLEGATQHQNELMADWELARRQAPLNKIDPLE